MNQLSNNLKKSAEAIAAADAIFVGTGAGMGVDSGLPDFRGNEGFWKAYPPMQALGLSFYDLANPVWFADDPERAWGFYGHRRNLYRETTPHAGFGILAKWFGNKPAGGFAFTSNVDGHFQKSGFDPQSIAECHGVIDYDQCTQPCCRDTWQASDSSIEIEESTFRAIGDLPRCRVCDGLARPNILMFGDSCWIESRTHEQIGRLRNWLHAAAEQNLVVIEIGAGTAVPTVRHQCENVSRKLAAPLIRINPRESGGAATISLPMAGLEALQRIDEQLRG